MAARADSPLIAIIIDDLGNSRPEGERVVALPGPVTASFLPHTPFARRLAERADAAGKEVMLHLPMVADSGSSLGPGGLTEEQSREQFLEVLRLDLASVPHARGINNHMGSLMTRDAVRMSWLMQELVDYEGIYFVDSRTTGETVAGPTALRHGVPSTRRDVFLDNDRQPFAIEHQFEALLAIARTTGTAVGIAHPRPDTLAMLEARLPQLAQQGIRLVPVSKIIAVQQEQRPNTWQASLSPSPPVAKSSKP
jgi:polysaccharide deacetylase 2 family uncharacterized protein YibQ